MNVCRYCDKSIEPEDEVPTRSYWQGLPFFSHRACKDAGYKAEALECQLIDRSCNECKHFERGKPVKYPQWNKEHTAFILVDFGLWTGCCKKFNRRQTAEPMTCMGMECFEHRKLSPQPK